MFKPVIGNNGVAHLLYFPKRRDDPFSIQNGGNLLFAEGVALYGEGTMDGADAVDPPQTQCVE